MADTNADRQWMALYEKYGNGRSYAQFNTDMSNFFSGLAQSRKYGSADTKERNQAKFLANVRAMK